jgi:outer membrane lipoprotein carrier protein
VRNFVLASWLLASLAGVAHAAAPAAKPAARAKAVPLPQLLQEVEAKYAKSQSLVAKFNQVVVSAISKQKQTSSGVLMFKRPNRIRWETIAPDKSLFVSNGKTAWYYTPPFDPDDKDERGEYRETPASNVQTKLANALLSGTFSVARDMAIKQESALRFSLTPRKKGAGSVQRAEIEIDPKTELISKVLIEHRGGNTTEISLSEIGLGKTVADDLFSFTPPTDADRVD